MNLIKSLLAFFFLYSCASFYDTEAPHSLKLELDRGFTVSVNLVSFDYTDNEEQVSKEEYEEVKQDSLETMRNVFKQSSKFHLVDTDSPHKDLIVEVEIRKKYASSLTMKILSGLTLYMIPRRSEEQLVFTARFYDKKKNLLGVVEQSDQLVTWRHILLTPFWPFMSSYHQSYLTIVKSMTQNAIHTSVKDKYFSTINK